MPTIEELEKLAKLLHTIKWRTHSGYVKSLAEECEQVLKRLEVTCQQEKK